MKMKNAVYPVLLIVLLASVTALKAQKIEGELKKWHKVTLVFDGPECSETDEYNPFFNYRLNVTFEHKPSGKKYVIPGYFAADGNAGQTAATSGNKWKVHFTPDETGEWNYSVEFVMAEWAAIRNWREKDLPGGEYMDGKTGRFNISPTDKTGKDFRAHGRLQYIGKGYLRFAETNEYFFKCGPDAPENFLSYYAFDGDFANDGHKDNLVKTWDAHLKDWKEGDPTWKKGKGKEIIGALNYLASKGMNSVSFLTNNIAGDDRNVFPYIDYDIYDRFDCSRLDQWEIVFTHAQENGIFLHFKTLEYENQGLLDNGAIGANTKLYYRELIARFGHHLALNWNLCEEIGDWAGNVVTMPLSINQRQALSQYIYDTDAYHHHMVIHNGEWFTPMYGDQSKLTGASLQTSREDFSRVHDQVKRVIHEAKNAGKVWAVACDEPGDHRHALITDEENPEHFNARTNGLWGAMLAGAWGTEWYFGYEHPHSDLTCEDWRSRDLFWNMGKICLDFFYDNDLPVDKMVSNDKLVSSDGDFCYALEGDTYIVLLKKGGESFLDLKDNSGNFSVLWYDTRNGGELQKGEVTTIRGGGKKSLGMPPEDENKDWVVLVRKMDSSFPGEKQGGEPALPEERPVIKIYSGNPFYWDYNGKPTLLIGGSVEDNLFQIPDLKEHLDLLVAAGGNYLRCTMSSRDRGNDKPYEKVDGLHDLNRPDPSYWNKFRDFLRFTCERDIIIQVELWATYDFYNSPGGWAENVFNPANNSNYTPEESQLPEVIDHTAQLKINPFFETVPQINDNEPVLEFQKMFIDRILSYSLPYNHVLYCIDNETNARPEWGAYWSNYIRERAKKKGKTIFITEMWDNWDPTGGNVEGVRQQEHATHPFLDRSKVANTIDAPELYDYIDVSNNNAQNGEVHYLSALYVRNRVEETGIIRPVNNVKIYGGTIYEDYTRDWAGSYKDGEERFWRDVFAGHASVRFHRPPYGHGLNPVAQHHIRSMRMLTDSLDFFHHLPSNGLLSDREPNEAFCLASGDREYAVYFPGQGEVTLRGGPEAYELRWLHIRSSTWRNPEEVTGPGTIRTPDNDQWAVWIRKK